MTERGAVLLWVLVSFFVLVVFMLAAVQPASVVAHRVKEEELLFRGMEYCEGLRQYQYEHGGAFPGKLEDLLQPGPKRHRYIRKLYRDPFDPEGKWGLLNPGTTVVTIGEDGKPVYNAGPLQSGQGVSGPATPQQGNPPQDATGTTGQGVQAQGQQGQKPGAPGSVVLPFRLNGQEGLPIVGVYCRVRMRAFKEFYGKYNYDEWYFSPLTVPPAPPIGAVQGTQPAQGQGKPPVTPPPGGKGGD